VIVIPEQYVVNVLYENIFKISYNKYNKTYNGCCPFCKEGKSWGVKKRFYYIPEKEVAYCHNCGYSKGSLNFILELTNKPLHIVVNEIKDFDIEIQLPREEVK
jgi:DNA primase